MVVMGSARPLVLLLVLVISCTTATPPPSETPAAVVTAAPTPTDTPAPTPTPKPLPARGRSVSVVGNTVVATGDFRGTRDTEVAVLDDPTSDLSLRIALRDSFSTADPPAVWLRSDRDFLSLARARFAVADVDFDGKDDLVALYNSGDNTSKLFVFRSTGSTFAFGGAWWSGDLTWSRARDLLAGKLGANGHDTLLVPFQDDESRMRVLAFESTGSKVSAPTTVYDSGKGQFDLSKTRFAVGHFTRATGAEQLVVLTQSKTRALARVLDPTEKGLALGIDILTDVDYDVTHSAIRAADVMGTGHDELVALYTDDKGGAKVQVFDLSSAPVSFLTPLRGWDGWATLGPGSVCGGPGALATGDWDKDGRADLAALAPGASAVRAQVMTSSGTALAASLTSDPGLLCPVWPLTGLPLGFADVTKRPLYVKTDNNPTARPHYGIAKADIVYEWLVEGLTTRLAAVYQSQQPDVLGSVRSVRMTDRHVLPALDAVLVYTGGGPEELMAVNYDAAVAHRYIDLSPNYGWGYRVPFRPAPYNFFTTYAQLRAAIADAPDADQPALVAPLRFLPTATGDPLAGGFTASVPAASVVIPYRAGFRVAYTYDPTVRTYVRFDDGDREVDAANNVAIAARNIVVIQTEVHFTEAFGLDPAGNPKLEEVLIGTGKAVVFRDGRRVDGTWTRDHIIDQFTLRDATGQVISLSPGQTWIHVVPNDWTIASQ